MADKVRNLTSDVSGKQFQEVRHDVVDAKNGKTEHLVIQFDRHGLTVECANGQIVVFDFSDSKLNIHHFTDDSEKILLASISTT